MERCLINCSGEPRTPDGWWIDPRNQIASRVNGELIWSRKKVRLHLAPGQKLRRGLKGKDLKAKLEGVPVLPVFVLDYLLRNPTLIPPGWKAEYVHFWGTIYSDSRGDAYVRCLCWSNEGGDWDWGDQGWRWCWDHFWLGYDWDAGRPAAVLAV